MFTLIYIACWVWHFHLAFLSYTERNICLNLFGTRKFLLVLQPKRIFLHKKNIFGSTVYFFTWKTYFLKLKALFFDLNIILLIVNIFSLKL